MSNETVFSTRPDRSRSIPAWAHFPPRIVRQNTERSRWSGCLECCKLLHVEKYSEFNSSLIVMRDTYELFSRECMQTGRTDSQEIRNDQSTILQEIRSLRFRSRTGSNYGRSFASSVVLTPKTRRHLVAFHEQRNWGRFIPDRNVKWNTKFPEFSNFKKTGQIEPREVQVNRNFRNEFPENVCSIGFWTGIPGNFGRMELALNQ